MGGRADVGAEPSSIFACDVLRRGSRLDADQYTNKGVCCGSARGPRHTSVKACADTVLISLGSFMDLYT